MASVYSDADLGLRLSEDGSPLPSARLVSQRLARVAGDSEKGDLSGHMMQWGQFRTHNMDHTLEEEIFQEARSIVIAELQLINEFLPLILSEETMSKLSEYNVYDPTLDATISNSFSTAAFRFGHSQDPENMRFPSTGCPRSNFAVTKLRDPTIRGLGEFKE